MPYVNIKVAGSLTREQREEIASDVATSLLRVAGKPKNVTYITFEEIPADHWSVGDQLLG